MTITISIVTVSYNDPKGLLATINSVLNQTYKNLEFIIIDGESDIETQNILTDYSPVISRIISEPDKGIYDAMNKGLDYASGDWVCFLNAGDIFYENSTLEKILPYFQKNIGIVFGKSLTKFKQDTVLRYENFESSNPDFYKKKLPNHQATFISLSLFGKHRYDLNYNYCADTKYLYELFSSCKYLETSEIITVFELGGASNYYSSFSSFLQIAHESSKLRKSLKPYFFHLFKYLAQRILGKEKYLEFYLRNGVRR